MAAKEMQYPWRWARGAIFTNLDVIWGMSAKNDHPHAVSAWKGFVDVAVQRPWKDGAVLSVYGADAKHSKRIVLGAGGRPGQAIFSSPPCARRRQSRKASTGRDGFGERRTIAA